MKEPMRVIISGGPGAGKSSLLEELKRQGYACQQEAARLVIQQHYQQNYTPWGDRAGFIRLVYERIFAELQLPVQELTFCDRSMVDCIGYLQEADLPLPDYLKNFDPHGYYSRQVFILPPWEAIYRKEEARQQEYNQSVSLYKSIVAAYEYYGFELSEVPPLDVKERAAFILNTIRELKS